jgi:hypothetical protein
MAKCSETDIGRLLRKYARKLQNMQFEAEAEAQTNLHDKSFSLITDCGFWADQLAHEYGVHHKYNSVPRISKGKLDIHPQVAVVLEKLVIELAGVEFGASKPSQGVLL